jgi:hypothetical protein
VAAPVLTDISLMRAGDFLGLMGPSAGKSPPT